MGSSSSDEDDHIPEGEEGGDSATGVNEYVGVKDKRRRSRERAIEVSGRLARRRFIGARSKVRGIRVSVLRFKKDGLAQSVIVDVTAAAAAVEGGGGGNTLHGASTILH